MTTLNTMWKSYPKVTTGLLQNQWQAITYLKSISHGITRTRRQSLLTTHSQTPALLYIPTRLCVLLQRTRLVQLLLYFFTRQRHTFLRRQCCQQYCVFAAGCQSSNKLNLTNLIITQNKSNPPAPAIIRATEPEHKDKP